MQYCRYFPLNLPRPLSLERAQSDKRLVMITPKQSGKLIPHAFCCVPKHEGDSYQCVVLSMKLCKHAQVGRLGQKRAY